MIKYHVLVFCLAQSVWAYEIPYPTFTAYSEGFEVSIPHADGIQAVEFSSERMLAESCRAAGTGWPPFTRSINGLLWTYKNTNVKLKNGDVFSFWISVSKNTQNYVEFCTISISKISNDTMAIEPETFLLGKSFQYKIPKPTVKAYRRGFEVSLAHEDGIELVGFTAELVAGGTSWHPLTLSDEHKLWTYKNVDVVHKLGGVFRFWITVRKEGFTYRNSFIFLIFKIYEETEKSAPPATSQYTIPNPSVKVHRTGFEISIPHENGMEMVTFSTVMNSQGASHDWKFLFAPDVNARWTYAVSDIDIYVGDTINYFVFVKANGNDYIKEDLVYTVESNDSDWYSGWMIK